MVSKSRVSYSLERFAAATWTLVPGVVCLLAVGVLTGCDSATLGIEGEQKVADNGTEVRFQTDSLHSAHFEFAPVPIPEHEPFFIELMEPGMDEWMVRIVHARTSVGYKLTAAVEPFDPTSVTITCRHEGKGMQRGLDVLRSDPAGTDKRLYDVGVSDEEPSSVHVIRKGDILTIEVDYDTDETGLRKGGEAVRHASFDFRQVDQFLECTHVGLVLQDSMRSLSPGGIQFQGAEAPEFLTKNVH